MDYQPEPARRPASYQAARERASIPGIFLAVVGGLNLIIAGILIVVSMMMQRLPADEFRRAFEEAQKDWSEQQKESWKEAQRQGWTIEKVREGTVKVSRGWGIAAAVAGFFGLLGGILMAGLRSYGLAVFGAILTAIPILSPCCLLGQIVGIWALVVLFNSDVHAAFKTKAGGLPPDEGMLR